MVVARRRQGGFLQLPCSLGFRLAFSATGGARLRPPAAFKKAGENLLENFSGFPAECAGGPLIGSGPLVLFAGSRGGKGWWMDRRAGGNSSVPGGGGGRARSALKERARGLWPRPRSFVWQAEGRPWGRPSAAKRRRPPAGPRRFHQRQKGKAKARPYGLSSHIPSTAGGSEFLCR